MTISSHIYRAHYHAHENRTCAKTYCYAGSICDMAKRIFPSSHFRDYYDFSAECRKNDPCVSVDLRA